jgi:sec-independent protein translocase protein TatC
MALVPFPGTSAHSDDPELWVPPDDDHEGAGKMSFLEHLDELRKRIINALIALAVSVVITFFFNKQIYDFIMDPLARMIPSGKLIFTEPTEAFMLRLKMSLLAGILLAAPAIMWQVWKFISPGLYENEKKFAVPFVVMSSIGFIGGAAFAHYVMFPFMWRFFASFTDEITEFMPRIDPIFSLYTKILLGMGLVFQMPSVVFFLAKLGLVTWRFLWRNIKYAILIIFIVAAVVTPDGSMVNQAVMAAPMIVLYFVSILIAAVFGKKRPQSESA